MICELVVREVDMRRLTRVEDVVVEDPWDRQREVACRLAPPVVELHGAKADAGVGPLELRDQD